MKKPIIFLITLMTIFSVGCENEGYYYTDWDRDSDHMINQEEFGTAFTDNEYYNTWDLNDDNFLDENEWQEGIGRYQRNYDADRQGAFDAWDLDDSGTIDNDEFVENSFGFWDMNGDGYVDEEEYQEWYYEY
jgi:Ca2+-binding EF-hand superfamily protein